MPGRRRAKLDDKPPAPTADQIAGELVAAVQREGAVPRAQITKRTPRVHLLAVYDALAAAGLEIGARFVRKPLEAQIVEGVQATSLPIRGLERAVAGATPAEAKAAAKSLIDRGRVRRIVLGKDIALASAALPVLDAHAHRRLADISRQLTVLLRMASRHDAVLLRAEVEALLGPPGQRPVGAPQPLPSTPGPALLPDVASLVDAHREASGLTFVPRLVRLLGGASARAAVHAELLRAAHAGELELRPESGMGRLSPEDASFCIPGPQGSRLSWVRRIEEQT